MCVCVCVGVCGGGHCLISVQFLQFLSFGKDLLISLYLNDLMNCYRCFNVDIMMFYISAMHHARKLKFNSYVNLPSRNKCFRIVTLERFCRRGIIFKQLYFSFLTKYLGC